MVPEAGDFLAGAFLTGAFAAGAFAVDPVLAALIFVATVFLIAGRSAIRYLPGHAVYEVVTWPKRVGAVNAVPYGRRTEEVF